MTDDKLMSDEQMARSFERARDFWRAKFERLNTAANAVMNLDYTDERLSGMWSGDALRIALEELEMALHPDFDKPLEEPQS